MVVSTTQIEVAAADAWTNRACIDDAFFTCILRPTSSQIDTSRDDAIRRLTSNYTWLVINYKAQLRIKN